MCARVTAMAAMGMSDRRVEKGYETTRRVTCVNLRAKALRKSSGALVVGIDPTGWWTDSRIVQRAVTTTALHDRPPLRRYACGTLESKYIESPAFSTCSFAPT